MIVVVASMLAV